MQALNAIELSIFARRLDAICDEMGAVLQSCAFSPNIKERLDFSCAFFDAQGRLCAQAAHIPVHLGSMAFAMEDLIKRFDWQAGDMVVLNDPYLGGTHLPDVTLVAPLFQSGQLLGFLVNRAHHADIGASTPGSMPISSTLAQEGVIIPPRRLLREDKIDEVFMQELCSQMRKAWASWGDFSAQISANRIGLQRAESLLNSMGATAFVAALQQINDYASRIAEKVIERIPDGEYQFTDYMDDDGMGTVKIPIRLTMRVQKHKVFLDFSGSAKQVKGNINCPQSVAAAAIYYVFRCLMPPYAPSSAGLFDAIGFSIPSACLLNARSPAAVAAGNVETSSRIVDVVMGALAKAMPDVIPAASQGSMNNIAMGSADGPIVWDYYETVGGGMGAGAKNSGLHAVQTHLTNTRNTPIEDLEMNFPVQVSRYTIRRGSGGKGEHAGGDGLLREFTFTHAATVTLLTERRQFAPWGINGAGAGMCGENRHNGKLVPAKVCLQVIAGDTVSMATPGGGAWNP